MSITHHLDIVTPDQVLRDKWNLLEEAVHQVDFYLTFFAGDPERLAIIMDRLQTIADQYRRHKQPSVPMMMRHRPAGSLPLRAEVTASDGYEHFE